MAQIVEPQASEASLLSDALPHLGQTNEVCARLLTGQHVRIVFQVRQLGQERQCRRSNKDRTLIPILKSSSSRRSR